MNDVVMNVEEVATWLRVDRKTLYRWIDRNEIPHRRCGRIIRFYRSTLERWLGGEEVEG